MSEKRKNKNGSVRVQTLPMVAEPDRSRGCRLVNANCGSIRQSIVRPKIEPILVQTFFLSFRAIPVVK